jgi:hypothetical protein
MGQGSTVVEGEKVYWVRYVTWFTTTPLLLLQLCRLVHARQSVVTSLVIANQFMIATGLAPSCRGAAELGVVRHQLGGLRLHPPHARRRPHARGRGPPRRRARALPAPARRQRRHLDRLPRGVGARHQGVRGDLAGHADRGLRAPRHREQGWASGCSCSPGPGRSSGAAPSPGWRGGAPRRAVRPRARRRAGARQRRRALSRRGRRPRS